MASLAENIEDAVKRALEEHVRKIVDEEVLAAQARVEKRVREGLAQLAMSVLKHYKVQHDRHEIVIRVDNRS